jgi:hypothetical protein
MISDQEILEQYKLSIEQDIKELLQEKNISDTFEIEAYTGLIYQTLHLKL